MIRRLRIEGFGPLRDVSVGLEPFTVLIGPNDVGKSMLLRALATLAEAGGDVQGWRGSVKTRRDFEVLSSGGSLCPIRWDIEGTAGGDVFFEYQAEIRCDDTRLVHEELRHGTVEIVRDPPSVAFRTTGETPLEQQSFGAGDLPLHHPHWLIRRGDQTPEYRRFQDVLERTKPALAFLSGIHSYALRPEALRHGYPLVDGSQTDVASIASGQLLRDGRGLPDALARLMLQDRDRLAEIEDRLRKVMPDVKRVNIEQKLDKGRVRNVIQIVTTNGTRVPVEMVSDGLMLYLAYLYIALVPGRQSLLLIEEPDHGLHPGQLERVVKLLRGLTEASRDQPATQVVVVTHSPILLDFLDAADIRIVTRTDGATRVDPFSVISDLKRRLEYLGPGEIWTNFGKDFPSADR